MDDDKSIVDGVTGSSLDVRWLFSRSYVKVEGFDDVRGLKCPNSCFFVEALRLVCKSKGLLSVLLPPPGFSEMLEQVFEVPK